MLDEMLDNVRGESLLSDAEVRARSSALARLAPALARAQQRRKLYGVIAVLSVLLCGAGVFWSMTTRPADRPMTEEPSVTRLSDTAVIAADGVYEVTSVGDKTTLRLTTGTISAKIAPGASVEVVVGEKVITASDAVFAVSKTAGTPRVEVLRGAVFLSDRNGPREKVVSQPITYARLDLVAQESLLPRGFGSSATWPAPNHSATASSAATSSAVASSSSANSRTVELADSLASSRPSSVRARPSSRGVVGAGTSLSAQSASASLNEQTAGEMWRRARHLRAQGNARQAAQVLRKLANRNDTWGPIALAELIEVHAKEQKNQARADKIAKEFARRFPGHTLLPKKSRVVSSASTAATSSAGASQSSKR